ncbi:MAG: type II toxin-antitoxin system HicB family antitoxin [Candidatus Doudnabacteria bacterium]|nr:type II toxin-antitoxin system HicB family antitoxin [Candidatus Doudnabacteria bacterium]
MAKINLQSAVWKEDKFYVAQCLNVDVSSFGKTKREAIKNLQEALELYFEDAKTPKISKIQKAELTKMSVAYA